MKGTMTVEKAKHICAELAAHKKRWGRHSGNAGIPEAEIREALILLADKGMFDHDDARIDVVAANRAKGAAEARATKYKKELDELKKDYEELRATLFRPE